MLWLSDWNLPVIHPSVFCYCCVGEPFCTMVGSNGTMMAIRIVHSKLRKREEHSASVHPAEVLAPAPAPAEPLAFRQQPLWQFPPPLPPPYVYSHDPDTLQPIGNERASFRSLRKNIGGRWKRLVNKKPEQEVYTIPPELKPQLKQIYVYWAKSRQPSSQTQHWSRTLHGRCYCDTYPYGCKSLIHIFTRISKF